MHENERLITSKQAAELLQLSELTLRRMVRRGDLHPVRFGRLVRYSELEVRALFRRDNGKQGGDAA